MRNVGYSLMKMLNGKIVFFQTHGCFIPSTYLSCLKHEETARYSTYYSHALLLSSEGDTSVTGLLHQLPKRTVFGVSNKNSKHFQKNVFFQSLSSVSYHLKPAINSTVFTLDWKQWYLFKALSTLLITENIEFLHK